MTALVLFVLGAVTVLALRRLLVTVVVPWVRRRRRPERLEECTCGAQVKASKAHTITAVYADADEVALGGMTAVSAAFCRPHCPGGCNHPKEHR